jgi:O-antigen/teichoic acid export membrane protein
LVSIPIVIQILGAEKYGVYLAFLSLLGVLGFLEGGIGHGLANDITSYTHGQEKVKLREVVSSAFVLNVISGIIALIILSLLIYSGAISTWLKLPESIELCEVQKAGIAVSAMFAIQLCFSQGAVILRGMQRLHVVNAIQILAGILSIGILCLFALTGASMSVIVITLYGPYLAVALGSWVFVGRLRHSELKPSIQAAKFHQILILLRRGIKFLYLQFAAALATNLPLVLIVAFTDLSSSVPYATASKLFISIYALASVIFFPLWPGFRDALAKNDIAWIKKSLARSGSIVVVVTSIMCMAAFFLKPIIEKVWLRNEVELDPIVMAGFTLLILAQTAVGPLIMLMNAEESLRPQIVSSLVYLVLMLLLIAILAHFGGILYVPLALALCFIMTHNIPFYLIFHRKFATT